MPGNSALIFALSEQWWLAVLLQPYLAGVVIVLRRLYRVSGRMDEWLAIGVGAELGNGLLTTLLGVLVPASSGADRATRATFVLALMVFYASNFVGFLRRPDRAAIGYKR